MNGTDYMVPPLSWGRIGEITEKVRSVLGLTEEPYFPVMHVTELVLDQELDLVRLEIGSRDEMDDAEGLTCPDGKFIRLREDVYEKGWAGEGRARFTAAHELGHFVLHAGLPLARIERQEKLPPFRRAEAQANRFAAEILMPLRFIGRTDSVRAIMKRHGVSRVAAQTRLDGMGANE